MKRDGDYSVTVKNLRTGDTFTGSVSSGGYFAAAHADLSRKPVIEVGDRIDGKNESGEGVASGIYYYTIDAGDFFATRKMIVKK